MALVFDTALVPPPERVEALRATYDAESPRRTVLIPARPVRHRVDRVDLGTEMHLLHTEGSPLQIVRAAQHVRGDAPEYVALGIHRHGKTSISTARREADLPVGHLNCVDMTSPYRLRHETTNEHDVLIVSNRRLGISVDVVRAAAPALERSPVYGLVRSHLAGLFGVSRQVATQPRLVLGQATSALVRALLLTAAEARGLGDAMDEALETRIELYLDAHVADPDLTAERIAAAHNISVRHLYNLWARWGADQPLAEWIMTKRLHLARQQLLDDARSTITAVARRCGFRDASHFSRRFRHAFGQSPREWRTAQRRDAPGR